MTEDKTDATSPLEEIWKALAATSGIMPRMHTHPQNSPLGRVVVGMSGGVDSAVAAALLLEAGFEKQGGSDGAVDAAAHADDDPSQR